MKVFDASNLIGIFAELGCPELFDHILKLGHELAVPSHVFENHGMAGLYRRCAFWSMPNGRLDIGGWACKDSYHHIMHDQHTGEVKAGRYRGHGAKGDIPV